MNIPKVGLIFADFNRSSIVKSFQQLGWKNVHQYPAQLPNALFYVFSNYDINIIEPWTGIMSNWLPFGGNLFNHFHIVLYHIDESDSNSVFDTVSKGMDIASCHGRVVLTTYVHSLIVINEMVEKMLWMMGNFSGVEVVVLRGRFISVMEEYCLRCTRIGAIYSVEVTNVPLHVSAVVTKFS